MFWKFYFFIQLLIFALYYKAAGFSRIWEQIDFPIESIALAGLFAFSWDKKFLFKQFWQVFLVVFGGWFLIYFGLGSTPEGLANIEMDLDPVIGEVISWIVLLPWFVALYLYGFRSRHLWE